MRKSFRLMLRCGQNRTILLMSPIWFRAFRIVLDGKSLMSFRAVVLYAESQPLADYFRWKGLDLPTNLKPAELL